VVVVVWAGEVRVARVVRRRVERRRYWGGWVVRRRVERRILVVERWLLVVLQIVL
jgi:hypothetical protein